MQMRVCYIMQTENTRMCFAFNGKFGDLLEIKKKGKKKKRKKRLAAQYRAFLDL